MQPLLVDLAERAYPIQFGPLTDLPTHLTDVGLRQGRVLIFTDRTVFEQHGASLVNILEEAEWQPHVIQIPSGEASKSIHYLQASYNRALIWGIDRKTPVLAFGGGVVGDLAGFAAATLLRGLPLVQIPTTLIAQVDSAIGGKTGINHVTGKNLIGAFYQPRLVYTDVDLLQTLTNRDWHSGLAEVLKYAYIADADFFDLLETHWPALLQRTAPEVPKIIRRSAEIKANIVTQDEREQGLRAILNFGHTFGHAIEQAEGYGTFTHGEAVALGMQAALYVSAQKHPDLPLERLLALVQQIPHPHLTAANERLIRAMQTDKKAEVATLRFILLHALGRAYVTTEVSEEMLDDAWHFVRG